MAGVEFELKDDELLDFDGSEYEYASDEPAEQYPDEDSSLHRAEEMQPTENGREARESVEGEARVEQPVEREKSSGRNRVEGTRTKHGTKSELEDGELVDMVNSKKQAERGVVTDRSRKYNDTMRHNEPERSGDSRHDRKRRRDSHDTRQYESRERTDGYEFGRSKRHDRYESSPTDRRRGYSDSRSRGGARPQAPNLYPNFGPGFMGPPGIHANLEASLGRFSPAHLQELLLQEHMLRSQQIVQLARLGVGAPRPVPPMHPPPFMPSFPRMWGPEMRLFGRGSRSMGPGILGSGRGASGGGEYFQPPYPGGDVRRGPLRTHTETPDRRRASQERRNEKKENEKKDTSQTPAKTSEASAATNTIANSSSIIQLGAPVQKSRVLIVSGLLENTPMSTIAEAFEKQGRVLDFQKNLTGDVFTVTYSSVEEALSAKRHLHRSILGGGQVTVEFASVGNV